MPVAYWQPWEIQPGHFADFQPVDAPKCFTMMTGKLEITASDGEKGYFSRGDVFLLQDTSGRGHTVRTLGIETASAVVVTMKSGMTEFAA